MSAASERAHSGAGATATCCASPRRSGRWSSACSTSSASCSRAPAGQPATARLFPVVHPDDAEREAEYQRLMRDELVTSRLAGIETVKDALARQRPRRSP